MIENTFYKVKQLYSITINPCDKHQYLGKPNRLSSFYNFIYERTMIWVNHGVDYYFKVEISEPHQGLRQGYSGPRYHLHGMIYFTNKNAVLWFLEQEIYRICKYAILDIDTIESVNTWVTYMQKQKIIPNKYRNLSNYITFYEFLKQTTIEEKEHTTGNLLKKRDLRECAGPANSEGI